MRSTREKSLVALAVVFLAVAAFNAVFALFDHVAWRSVTAGACAVASAGLLFAALTEHRR
ncbi:hypothetical protein AB0A74_36070 [Saccharothrix sp. NPDC042600]|uniref:hypothetical protein n=1 Tax=Saccharothrix TaxID=2071 RepID=UPI0033DAB579|nr:hypothetical protein GCM10017745_33030 [Saccharothrix mutabilis subsp. capreolus]